MNAQEAAEFYHPYSRYLERTFGEKTYKVVVASGLSCPNRDGTIGKDPCAFCDLRGSSSFHGKQGRGGSAQEQIARRIPAIRERFGARKFLAYFQSYTNTHGDAAYLREIYTEALSAPGIDGLCIGTRPDSLSDEVLQLLQELASRSYVSLELGVQSFEDPVLDWLRRGHDGATSLRALERLSRIAPAVHVCAHLIFGSPLDSPGSAREAARALNRFPVRGAKLHQLMILEGTELARRYRENPFPTLSLPEYAERVQEFLENLSPEIYIERLYATATHPEECLAPEWSRERWATHNRLRELLLARGCRQGRRRLPA